MPLRLFHFKRRTYEREKVHMTNNTKYVYQQNIQHTAMHFSEMHFDAFRRNDADDADDAFQRNALKCIIEPAFKREIRGHQIAIYHQFVPFHLLHLPCSHEMSNRIEMENQ